jgi:hypothetical protein
MLAECGAGLAAAEGWIDETAGRIRTAEDALVALAGSRAGVR